MAFTNEPMSLSDQAPMQVSEKDAEGTAFHILGETPELIAVAGKVAFRPNADNPFFLGDAPSLQGVAQHFFDIAQPQVVATLAPPEFDLVYLGEMGRLAPFLPVLHTIHAAGRSLLLVGDVPDAVRLQLPPSVTCTGRVPHADVPRQLRRARFGLNLVSNVEPYNQQTSTKVLEYCAAGLRVVSNDYAWVRYFAAHYEGNFHLLHDDPNTWQHSFGEALEAYPYRVPDVRALAWHEVLKALPIWSVLFGAQA